MTDKTKEPVVMVAGPPDHKDVFDVATGLRFVEGRALAPLSLAQKIARERRGYFVLPYNKLD